MRNKALRIICRVVRVGASPKDTGTRQIALRVVYFSENALIVVMLFS